MEENLYEEGNSESSSGWSLEATRSWVNPSNDQVIQRYRVTGLQCSGKETHSQGRWDKWTENSEETVRRPSSNHRTLQLWERNGIFCQVLSPQEKINVLTFLQAQWALRRASKGRPAWGAGPGLPICPKTSGRQCSLKTSKGVNWRRLKLSVWACLLRETAGWVTTHSRCLRSWRNACRLMDET